MEFTYVCVTHKRKLNYNYTCAINVKVLHQSGATPWPIAEIQAAQANSS
jgi:hypothetical protein